MTREWQVIYRGLDKNEFPVGPLQTINVFGQSVEDVTSKLDGEVAVIGVSHIRDVVDWSKPNFDRDEAAAFLAIKPSTLSVKKGDGVIPFAEYGQALYPRKWLLKLIEKHANTPAQQIIKSLHEEVH